MNLKKIVSIVLALVFLTAFGQSVASATPVTNTFYGTVVAGTFNNNYVTTNDFGNYFGGGDLIGQSFVLSLTLDAALTGVAKTPNTVYGGSYYGITNPLTSMSLTINGFTYNTIENTSYAQFYLNGIVSEQDANYVPGTGNTRGVNVNISTVKIPPVGYSNALAAMQLSNGDFSNLASQSYFIDKAAGAGEVLALNVLSVNALPVPVPPSAILFGSRLLGLAGWRRLRKS